MNGSGYTCTKMFKSHWIIIVFDYCNFVSRDFISSLFAIFILMTRLAAASDKVYQLLAHARWFSPGIPASSATKTGRHDIAEILLKMALNTKNQIKYLL